MALYQSFEKTSRLERFSRLVEAHEAACKHHMYISAALFSEDLQNLGAYLNYQGKWTLPELEKRQQ